MSASSFQALCPASCVISGFADTDQIRLVVTSDDGSGLQGRVRLAPGTPTTGLQAVTGYNGGDLTNLSDETNPEIAFVGTQDEINAVLPELQYKGTLSARSETITISATLAGVDGRTLHYFPGTGNYYEFVDANVAWSTAKTAAEARTFNGLTGYLATILTEAENSFITDKVTSPNLWIGATFTPSGGGTPTYSSNKAGSWQWVTGPAADRVKFWDGTRYGSAVAGRYANWNTNQPDGSSDCAVTNFSGAGMWDDFACTSTEDYLVEYGGLDGQTATVEVSSQVAVYVPYVVTFNPNGAAGSAITQEGRGSTILRTNDFERASFYFNGWNTESNGTGTFYSDGETISLSSDLTLYAQWSRDLICSTLTDFDADDFRLLEDATVSGSQVTLTTATNNQKGGFWSLGRVDLSSDFCVSAETYVGSSDAGADGIALVLQSVNSSSLTSGGGLGYAGINPSFAVEIDTYFNSGANPPAAGDPSTGADHIALMKDGSVAAHNSWGVNPVELTNIEDGSWRLLTLEWDASAETATVYYDNTARFGGPVSVDLGTYFASSSGTVFWGFTGATGGANNLQEVRNIKYAAQPRTNQAPTFVSPPGNTTYLFGSENQVTVTLSDDSTTEAQWQRTITVADSSIFASLPTFVITGPTSARLDFDMDPTELGSSLVTLTITDADGATATHSFTVTNATTLPAPPPAPAPAVQPPTTQTPQSIPPRQQPAVNGTQNPLIQDGPVLRNNQVPTPPSAPQSLINGVPTQVSTLVTDPNSVNIRAGVLNLGLNVQNGQGGVRQNGNGSTELDVVKGGQAGLQGSGLQPGSFVQVFMPLQGTNSREIGRLPVDQDGSFSGNLVFGNSPKQSQLPIGRNVLQMVSVDEQGRQTVVEMTVNVAQPPPAPQILRQDQSLPSLPVGDSIATRDGLPIPVTVSALPDQGAALVEGDGWNMSVEVGGENSVSETESGAALTFTRNQSASVSGSGLMPGTRADIWLFSDPTLLGSVTVGDDGSFTGFVNIDPNVITVGEHTLQLQGVGTDGYVLAANLGVLVTDEDAAVGSTNERAGGLLWWLVGVVAFFGGAGVAGYLWWRSRQRPAF